jgi:DNA repair protein RadC
MRRPLAGPAPTPVTTRSPARAREKLLQHGPQVLADVELLALLLRTGRRGHDVFALAQELLDHVGGFAGLLAASRSQLAAIRGLGPAKASEIAAVAEIARRAIAQQMREAPVFDVPQKVKDYAALKLGARPHEVFLAMFLDGRRRLIADEEMFRGTLGHTSVHPRELVRRALHFNAAAIVIAHNHPSGLAEPSRTDVQMTQTIRDALALIDVQLLDHLIVGLGQVVSLAERGVV